MKSITIPVKDVSRKMFLRRTIAEGLTKIGEKEIHVDITSVIGSGDIHIKIGEKSYLIELEYLVESIIKEIYIK